MQIVIEQSVNEILGVANREKALENVSKWQHGTKHIVTRKLQALRWLDRVFHVQYLPILSINYVAINKALEQVLPQLY